jgi:hypothetical protein
MAKSMEEIAEMLKSTRFRRRFFGGVDEDDVWKKIEKLQKEYAELIEADRQRAQGVLKEWQKCAYDLDKLLTKKNEQLKALAAERACRMQAGAKTAMSNQYG